MTPSVMLKPGRNGELLLVPVRPDGSDWVRWTGPAEARLQSRGSAEVSHRSQVGFHSSSPSSQRPNHGAESEAMSSEASLRNPRITRNEIRKSLHDRLSATVPMRVVPAKEIVRHVDSSVDTIEARRGGNIPVAWAEMIEWCRAYPAFGMEVLELMGIDIDHDPRAFAKFLELKNMVNGGGK
jgi:hypothetical protein